MSSNSSKRHVLPLAPCVGVTLSTAVTAFAAATGGQDLLSDHSPAALQQLRAPPGRRTRPDRRQYQPLRRIFHDAAMAPGPPRLRCRGARR